MSQELSRMLYHYYPGHYYPGRYYPGQDYPASSIINIKHAAAWAKL